jgi:hypothetical protein
MSERSSAADGRRYSVSQIPDLGFWPDDIGVPGEPFCLLLLCGDEVLEDELVESFASHALRQGMLYLSVWGTASEWVEDLVDQVYEDASIAGELNSRLLVTTAHSDLDEAINFFEHDVRPAEDAKGNLWWVVSVGNNPALELATRRLEAGHRVERLSLA